MNLQAALAAAEAEKRQVVQQADEIAQVTRVASRDALLAREAATAPCGPVCPSSASGPPTGARACLCPGCCPTTATPWPTGWPRRGSRSRGQERPNRPPAPSSSRKARPRPTGGQRAGRSRRPRHDRGVGEQRTLQPRRRRLRRRGLRPLRGRGDRCPAQQPGWTRLPSHLPDDDPELLGWAIGLPHEAGGASTISTSRTRKPALVSD